MSPGPDDPPFEHELIRVGGLGWHTLTAGHPHGPPVVVVHGLGAASEAQRPVARLLARQFRVLVPDLPGFGRSEAPGRPLDVPGLADALALWLDVREQPPAALIGNSMGCQVVAQLAARHPRRVRAAVLQGPTIDGTARTRTRQVGRLALDSLFERPSLSLVQARGVRQAGFRRLRVTLRAALADRIEDTVTRVACPVLVVRGSRDPVVSQTWAETIAARALPGEIRLVPGTGHGVLGGARTRPGGASVPPALTTAGYPHFAVDACVGAGTSSSGSAKRTG